MRTERQGRRGGSPDSRERHARRPGAQFEHLYGRNAVREALSGRRNHRRLILAEGLHWDARLQELKSAADSKGISVETAPRHELDAMAPDRSHQGVILQTSPYPYVQLHDLPLQGKPLLILDHLQDPQNFGSLLRSAEAFGVEGIVIPRDRSAEITPAVVNSSAGAVEHLSIAQATNLGRALDDVKQSGYWVAGLDRSDAAVSLDGFDPPGSLALVVGSEGKGMTPSIASRCDILLIIEQIGKIESLNASVAGSIALFCLTRTLRTQRANFK